MTFRYDRDADALDITLSGGIVCRTVGIDSGTLVDVDEHGRALAIEIIRPARAWPLDEILDRFGVADEDATVLRTLWNEESRYPFEEPAALALA